MTATIDLNAALSDILETTNAEARPYQERVVTTAYDNFTRLGVKTQLVNSPTGSGKTVMGLAVARWLQQEHNIGVGWCAMRRNLLTQSVMSNVELNMGVEQLTPISMFDKNPPSHDAAGRPIKLLVVDEAQHDAASSMGHLHNTIEPQWVLGLSATPFRTDKLKLCFEKVIRDAGIHQLIQQGYLSQYHQYAIPAWTVDTVVERYLADPDRWGKSGMYWLNEALMHDCHDRLRDAGVRTAYVYGKQTNSVRDDILERFDATTYGDGDPDGIDVIVNMFILTEGWDCPSLKTAWVRDSSKGPTIQMAGRVFRQYDYPFKQIVQSENTKYPIQRQASPHEAFIWTDDGGGGSWRSVKPSDKANKVSSSALHTLARIQTDMPDFIKKNRGKKRFGERGDSGLERRDDSGGWGASGGGAFIH